MVPAQSPGAAGMPAVLYVPTAIRAMGIPKKHLFRDCRHIKNAVVRTAPADSQYLAYLPLCKTCEKRYRMATGAGLKEPTRATQSGSRNDTSASTVGTQGRQVRFCMKGAVVHE